MKRAALALGLVTFLGTIPTHAQPQGTPLPVRYEIEVPVASALAIGWLGSELLKSELAPHPCRICGPAGGLDGAARNALVWEDTEAARFASNVTTVGVAPLGALGLLALGSRDGRTFGEDAFFVAEAVVFAGAINQATKFLIGRERPFVSVLSEDEKSKTEKPNDNNLSFYSGHTSLVASLGASAAMVASLRGYETAPYLWAFFGTTTLATGYFRIAADRHYASDVLVGALLGGGIGALVPWLLHRPTEKTSTEGIDVVPGASFDRSAAHFSMSGTF